MAVEVKTIQMRRGLAVDFDPNRLMPGEWAVSQDNEKIYLCFTAGRVLEIATTTFLRDAEAWAVGERGGIPVSPTDITYHNNSKYYAGLSSDSATAAATSEENAAESEENAGQYWEYVHDAVDLVIPEVTIDFTTGQLMYSGSQLLFWIDTTTGNLMWNVVTH